MCNFALPDGGTGDDDNDDASRLMAHSEVETLFHEFGHALHSLLSRTEFQHVSGEWIMISIRTCVKKKNVSVCSLPMIHSFISVNVMGEQSFSNAYFP